MKSETRGRLKIGDQWNAINILARSQTHPLKAVCELTENAIDARSTRIEVTRMRRRGRVYIELQDDGHGVPLNDAGDPDFAYIATHICDSMKRHLSGQERAGVHGEFGIGLLSFWSLGEELRMTSSGDDGRRYELTMLRGEPAYTVRPVRGELPGGRGTRVVVGPLLDVTRSILTGEKLQRYLSAELRNRICNTGVQIHINDRVARRKLIVTPREFEGDPLELPKSINTTHGRLYVDLYLHPNGAAESRVALCKDGTRVLRDIRELIQFQRSPWTEGRLEGVIDYDPLNLAPGTRSDVVPDIHLDTFVQTVQRFEAEIVAAIENRDRAERERASEQILKQVHKAFVHALQNLPVEEYYFFDIPERTRRGRPGSATASQRSGLEVAAQTAVSQMSREDDSATLPLEAGPLEVVTIVPKSARKRIGETCTLTARPRDENGIEILSEVEFEWSVTEGGARLEGAGHCCQVTSGKPGLIVVEVTAKQAEVSTRGHATVRFVDTDEDSDESKKGLPTYRLEPEHGSQRRSRYDARANEIVINSAHRDFLASTSGPAKHRRYIGKLYAKEVVLINFAHETPGEIMERLIEVLVRTEDSL